MHGRNADILQRRAGVVLPHPGVYAGVLLGDDTALLKFVEQEATMGGDVAIAFVFAQQLETLALQTTATRSMGRCPMNRFLDEEQAK